jgi:acetoin utilization deacetylase AcuC-like enzyme
MNVWAHDRWSFPLPPQHRYPQPKYRLLRERLISEGVCTPHEINEADPIPWWTLIKVHDPALLGRIRRGQMSVREQRGLGLPWSPELVERARRSVNGTVLAAYEALRVGVAMNLGGGTHHAGWDFARGFCLFNDVAVAASSVRRAGVARRVLVVDCDVHQGDGTAQLLASDAQAFTLSLHGARNYPFKRIPSDLDLDLPRGTADAEYCAVLDGALATALARGGYDVAFYLAGADPWEGDRLGTLGLTKAGLRRRDALVLDTLQGAGVPVCVVLAGGYAPDISDTVDINAAAALEVAARTRSPSLP